jgi:butyrate kinase
MKIFVINPGSTSTKIALYEDDAPLWVKSIHHPAEELAPFHHAMEQYDYRLERIKMVLGETLKPGCFEVIVARGGLLHPTPGGVYEVDERMKEDLRTARMEHVCNLGALLADELAKEVGCRALIADPEVVDELLPKSRLTGIPEIQRYSVFHALNSKAVSRKYAKQLGRTYEELRLIVVHLGGGISVSAHDCGRVIDVNNALNGEGPFSPERAGTLPGDQLVELCFSGKYTLKELKKLLNGKGGLVALLGTNHVPLIVEKAQRGEEPERLVLEAMLYNVAKAIGAMHVALQGKTDAILLTGGIAYSDYCVQKIAEQVDFLAPVKVFPGEDEMSSLAENAYAAMIGNQPVQIYAPDC